MNPASDLVNPIEVDARGLRCPLPVIRLAEAARDAPAGTWIIVLASDPAARYDIPAWCRMRDHELREMTPVPEMAEAAEMSGTEISGTEMSGTEMSGTEISGAEASGTGDPLAEGAQRAYLRFVVLIRAQRSKAGGTGSDSERPSRAT